MTAELPSYFKQTCDNPYDRHLYKLVFASGLHKMFDDYMEVQAAWFQTPEHFLSHVEVLDKKKSSKGFK